MNPTDIKDKDDLIKYLSDKINEKDQYIESLLNQIGMLLGKLKDTPQ
jgi:uncharacterized coiled-coil protein SlyX